MEFRTQKMLDAGLVDEVKTLRDKGFKDWAPLQSVGYKEVQLFLDQAFSEKELPEKITTATMQLIKKQQTWFNRDKEIHWFKPHEAMEALDWLLEETTRN